ncbi:MAG TPA: NAD(P)H-binding protein [Thermoleophilaceae bacterium]
MDHTLTDAAGRARAPSSTATVLLTGATGFVGHELLGHLRSSPLRCLVRDASRLLRDDEDDTGPEAIEADLSEIESLRPALEGIEEVFYLVHSMEPGSEGFADRDRRAATNYAEVAASCGVRRTIYLGGIAAGDKGSEHLESRHEVEEVLAAATPEFVGLRASMIVGARSGSFRALVQLVDRLPVLALPSWRESRTQPIAIGDVVECLLAARQTEPGVYDVAGPDVLSFEEMTEVVSELLGQRHRSVSIPFSNAPAEAALAAVVTDEDRALLEPLMAGLHSDLLVDENAASSVFGIEPTPFREAAAGAIEGMRRARADGALVD